MKKAKLVITLGQETREFVIDRKSMIIGRGTAHNPDIVINDQTISRQHARIFLHDEQYFIEDMSTFRRTYLNDIAIESASPLKNNDMIRLGNVVGRFVVEMLAENNLERLQNEIMPTMFDEALEDIPNDMLYAPSEQNGANSRLANDAKNQEDFKKTQKANDNKSQEKTSRFITDLLPLPKMDDKENTKENTENPSNDKATATMEKGLAQVLNEDSSNAEDAPLETGEADHLMLGEIPFATPATDLHAKIKLEAELYHVNTNSYLALVKHTLYVGRDSNNDIVIEHHYFAKRQFSIIFNKNSHKHFITQLGDNETRVNGVPVENTAELTPIAWIACGEHSFVFMNGTDEVRMAQLAMRIPQRKASPQLLASCELKKDGANIS